jgi:hypothetical protein
MSYLLVGLDYVKDRWAFQKEDGSEHKEPIQACALPRDIVTRFSFSFFLFMNGANFCPEIVEIVFTYLLDT